MSANGKKQSSDKTTRHIHLIGENGNEEVEQYTTHINFDKKSGTPQKRLHDLLVACKSIVTNDRSIFNKGKIKSLNVDPLIDALIVKLSKSTRDDIFETDEDRDLFCKYIYLFISSLNSTSNKIDANKIFITVWLLVLVKSMSDISQCGSLVNDIPKLYKDKPMLDIERAVLRSSQDVLSLLNSNINVTFFSSDKICAALSTNILKLIDYPIQTLCSRKTGTTTQTMIIQKGEVSALSVVLSVVGDIKKSRRLIRDIIYYDIPDTIKGEVVNMVTTIHTVVTNYYTSILENYSSMQNFEEKYILQDIIQLEIDKLFSSKHQDAQTKLCKLIYDVLKIPNLIGSLIQLSYVLSSKESVVVVPRWTYHVSNDIFKCRFPLTSNMFRENTGLKNKISREEILSATADAMYGHDFALSCITELGTNFLKAIGEADVYSIDENISYSKKEDLCISQTLQLNNFSTINQHGDKFSINFNSDSNYLVVDRKEMFYRISEIPWNITASPLVEQDIIASVDFVSGEPSISVVLSEQVNFIKQQNIRKSQVFAFSVLTQTEDLTQKLEVIKQNTNYREYNGVTTLYDGAAPYGGLPIYELEQYISSMNIILKSSSKKRDDVEENLTLRVITETTEKSEDLRRKWVSERVNLNDVPYFTDTLNLKVDMSEEQKIKISAPAIDTPLYKFNLIWGTILNSKPNMTEQYRKEIYGEFNSVVTEIQNKIKQIDNNIPERSRRASTQQPMSRFFPSFKNIDQYRMFNDDKVQEQIKKIYKAVSENENVRWENFDVMMIEYIKILLMPEPPNTRDMDTEVVATDPLGSTDTSKIDDSPNTGNGDTKTVVATDPLGSVGTAKIEERSATGGVDTEVVATTNPSVSVETKQILLTILEVAVRSCKLCSDDPDGIFKSLLSDSKINQEINVDKQLQEIGLDAQKKINREETIKRMKEIFLQNISTKRGQSNNIVEHSGASGVSPVKTTDTTTDPGSAQSAFAAFKYTDNNHKGRQAFPVTDLNSQDDSRKNDTDNASSNSNNELIYRLQNEISELTHSNSLKDQQINRLEQQNSDLKSEGQHFKSEASILSRSPTSGDKNKYARRSSSIGNNSSSGNNSPFLSLSRFSSNNDEDVTTTPKSTDDDTGGSRKHHIQTHKTVTRRKNKKSPKRKTIKKRKMPKIKNKTRRNK